MFRTLTRPRRKAPADPRMVQVVNTRDHTKAGLLVAPEGRLPVGTTWKVYQLTRIHGQEHVFMIEVVRGHVTHAVVKSGDFDAGDIIRVEADEA